MNVEKIPSSGLRKVAAIVIGLVVIVVAIKLIQITFTRASDVAPRDVVISEITANSSKVAWTTGQAAQAVIEYGTSPTSLNFFAPETKKTTDHAVDLTLLSPETTYYFRIRIGDKVYNNGGVPWSFSTRGRNQPSPPPKKSPPPTVKPTAVPTSPTPTPVSTVDLPEPTKKVECGGTDCAAIKAKITKGCTTQDYFRCLNSTAPTATPSATPTSGSI